MRHAILTALLLTGAAAAQTAPDAHRLALAAGYKAAFLCSDIFTAGRSEAQATADDLTGIYPEYEALIPALPATIDRQAHTVSVAFDAKLPPRIAAWRPLNGCAQLPVGAGPEVAAQVPRLEVPKPDYAARPWPLGDRGGTAPAPAALAAVVAAAFDHASYGKGSETSAIIVLKDGRIVAEQYRPDFDAQTPQRTWSVAKSLTATIVGVAVAQGRIKVSDPARVEEWQRPGDPRQAITYEQLLRMNSGLWTNGPGNRTDALYLGGSSVSETAAAAPLEAAPGSRFRYANNDMVLAAAGLRSRLGADGLVFPFWRVLWPLGMTHTTPETDWQGNYVLSSQVWMTARDVARLALLYERGGLAPDGQRLLPADWVEFVTAKRGAQPESETSGGSGYGAGFWIRGAKDGLPAGTYSMDGNRGQYAVIVPASKVIVIRRGFDAPNAAFDPAAFTRDVLAALATARDTRTR